MTMATPGDMSEGSMYFWRTYLDNAQATEFPSALIQDQAVPPSKRVLSCIGTCKIAQEGSIGDDLLVAAWALVISLHALSEDVVFGLFSKDTNGQCLPVRVLIPEDHEGRVPDLISNIQQDLQQINQYSKHDGTLQHVRDLSASCKAACGFTTLLNIRGQDSADPSSIEELTSSACAIVVEFFSVASSIGLKLHADRTVHTGVVSEAILRHFCSAVEALSTASLETLGEIYWSDDTDLEQLAEWVPLPEPVPEKPYLHCLVEEQARLRPLAVAIGQSDSVMTYAELEQGATALASHLRSISAERKVGNVGVLFSKSAFAVLAMLAILKAGGAYVPIDPQWPASRTVKIYESAQIKVVLCSEEHQAKLKAFSHVKAHPVTAKSIYGLKKGRKIGSDADLSPRLRPEMPAYIMYTSGSTGSPKGVEVSHKAITTSVQAMARYFGTTPETRALQFNAFTFDVSVGDIFVTLSCGGRLCMPTEDERFSLNEFILAERVNFAYVTPSIAATTINPKKARENMCRLDTIGEKVSQDFLARYAPAEDTTDFTFHDTWGPTEASVFATGSASIKLDKNGRTQRAGNIGVPVGCSLFIVSAGNPHKLSPAFVPGEIVLVGPTLATGYWDDEEKTSAAFRTDLEWTRNEMWISKLGDETMSRVYMTGDIGRYSENGDGSVVFMHRRGGYMKVNGLRIDPGEVEAAIVRVGNEVSKDHEGPALNWNNCAVCMLEGVPGNEHQQSLICFLAESETTSQPGAGCELRDLSKRTKALLQSVADNLTDVVPEYMVPSMFASVNQLPHTTAFKLDRMALLGSLQGMHWTELVEKYAIDINSDARHIGAPRQESASALGKRYA